MGNGDNLIQVSPEPYTGHARPRCHDGPRDILRSKREEWLRPDGSEREVLNGLDVSSNRSKCDPIDLHSERTRQDSE